MASIPQLQSRTALHKAWYASELSPLHQLFRLSFEYYFTTGANISDLYQHNNTVDRLDFWFLVRKEDSSSSRWHSKVALQGYLLYECLRSNGRARLEPKVVPATRTVTVGVGEELVTVLDVMRHAPLSSFGSLVFASR